MEALSEVSRSLRDWLGPDVGVSLLWAANDLKPEYEAEATAVLNAFPGRKSEFLTGRHCARNAMQEIGASRAAIGIGTWGQPEWPAGVVGSISHDMGICLAVVGSSSRFEAIGIDLISDYKSFSMEFGKFVFSPSEERSLSGAQSALKASVAFSAKEAVIKVISTRLDRLVDFLELEIVLDWNAGEFQSFVLSKTGRVRLPRLSGHFVLKDGAVFTWLAVQRHLT